MAKKTEEEKEKTEKFKFFKNKSWFNEIAFRLQTDSPFLLEKLLQPWKIHEKEYGETGGCSNMWALYREGNTTPGVGLNKNGQLGPVLAAKNVGDSYRLFNHDMWNIVLRDRFQFTYCLGVLKNHSNYVKRHYYDLRFYEDEQIYRSFLEHAGSPIHISEEDDLMVSLDHLSMQLILLKMDCCIFNKQTMHSVIQNIALTLGPISVSPWIGPFYEDFFDWLEKYFWFDIFDKYYICDDSSIRGWRKTRRDWVIPKYY